jgi:uncharacterized protein (DUF1778 family)
MPGLQQLDDRGRSDAPQHADRLWRAARQIKPGDRIRTRRTADACASQSLLEAIRLNLTGEAELPGAAADPPPGRCALAPRRRCSHHPRGASTHRPPGDWPTHRPNAALVTDAEVPYICTERAVASKTDRLEARLTTSQRRQIEQAAELAGESVSAFVVLAALERADILVTEQATTVLPSAYFDQLVAALDEPDEAPRLQRAARNAARRRRINPA